VTVLAKGTEWYPQCAGLGTVAGRTLPMALTILLMHATGD
jgi:hypothetical protein